MAVLRWGKTKVTVLSPKILIFYTTAILFGTLIYSGPSVPTRARSEASQSDLTLQWEKNILKISSPRMPDGHLEIWYLEAFCRRGSTKREWQKTVIPHETRLVAVQSDGKELELESLVNAKVRVHHLISVVADGVDFRLNLKNLTGESVDIEWAQPCFRVGSFTGLGQEAYIRKCFLFTNGGLTMLDRTRRTQEALYHGGQVYVPEGISLEDVNPRPISPDTPINGLIGCYSRDGKYLLATAWEPTEELFQGVIVCIHNDFRIGGLAPHETKQVHGKLYFLKNDVEELLKHYRLDFGK